MTDKRKTTTKQQFEVLALLIEKNNGIAGDRDKGTNKFWQEVTTTLNELGPPTKDASGWKKVWADYKSALKKKLAHNKNEYRSTGGGPCSMRSFNALEQKIIEVLDLQRSIVGTPNVPALGVVLPEENQLIVNTVESQPATGLQNESTEPEEQGESQITNEVEAEVVAEVETRPGPSQVIPNERRGKKRTVAEQHLLELRKFNAIQQRLLLLKTEKQETNKKRLELERENSTKEFELKKQKLEIIKELAQKKIELEYAKLEIEKTRLIQLEKKNSS